MRRGLGAAAGMIMSKYTARSVMLQNRAKDFSRASNELCFAAH
jgi:hypothetical protein